jgi:hypothetical protein
LASAHTGLTGVHLASAHPGSPFSMEPSHLKLRTYGGMAWIWVSFSPNVSGMAPNTAFTSSTGT